MEAYQLPTIIPAGWTELERQHPNGLKLMRLSHPGDPLTVIISFRPEYDGRKWLHVSLAHPDRIPTFEDVKLVRDLFIPRHLTALQIFPPADRWVSIHPYVLHLWACLDGDVVPDFTRKGMI